MRRRNKKKNFLFLLLLLVLILGIGYALIFTNLTINGVGRFNNQNWNVHFEDLTYNPGNVILSQNDVVASINQTSMTDITFTVTLQEPGDFYEFEVAAVNSGTMDAMVGLITNNLNGNPIGTGNEVPAYARYTATYSDGVAIASNHLLQAGYSETYKVRLEYRTDIDPEDLPDEVEELSFTFGVQYVQADSNAIEKPIPEPFELSINTYDISVGEIAYLYVSVVYPIQGIHVIEDFNGDLYLESSDGNFYQSRVTNGYAELAFPDLTAGCRTFFITVTPDDTGKYIDRALGMASLCVN